MAKNKKTSRKGRGQQDQSSASSGSKKDSSFRVSHAKLIAISQSMVALQNALYNHPKLNKAAPQSSPQLLFFTTDFLIRTMRDYLPKLDPDRINAGNKAALEVYQDVLTRNFLLDTIINDKSGKSNMFGKPGEDFEFGEEVDNLAKALTAVCKAPAEDGSDGEGEGGVGKGEGEGDASGNVEPVMAATAPAEKD